MNLSDLRVSLSKLVTRGDTELERRAARLTRLSDLFFERYGDGPVSLLRAPARINVLGEHVDYVSYLPTASLTFGSRERYALMMYRRGSEPIVRCASTSPHFEPASFSIFAAAVPRFQCDTETEWLNFLFAHGTPAPAWENYINSAVTFARGKFGQQIQNGFDFALDSDIPAGGGASSSSALVVLGGAAIRNVNGISWTPEGLARDSALAEWFIGTRGGSMDHTTICLAQPASAVLIDYAAGQTRRVNLPDEPFEWVTFFSKPADKGREVMIEYNERAAVSRLLIPAILKSAGTVEQLPETISLDAMRRDYPETFSQLERSFPALIQERSRWPLKIRVRGLHHLGEVQRVALATETLDSLNRDDASLAMQKIGNLLDQSHASLRDLYEVSIPEVEELIAIIREDSHVLGARLMGGGFGGNVLALTTREHTNSLIEHVQHQYYDPRQRDGVREGSVMISTPGRGLDEVDLKELWRDSIANINSLGAAAASQVENLRALIDAASVSFDPRGIGL
jgi:galactokinase